MPKKRVRANKQKDVVPAHPEETPEVEGDLVGDAPAEPVDETDHPVKDGRPNLGEFGPDHTAKAQEEYNWAKNVGLEK